MAVTNRVILLVDIDCFYCQVEEKLNPNLRGKPVAVVQFNTWREGGIIAANYLARKKGVTKGLWCHEAKEKCPDILFATVNEVRGRADLTKYRDAGKEVFDVLQRYTTVIEKASVDEAYLDITEAVNRRLQDEQISFSNKMCSTHVVGYEIEDFLENLSSDSEFSEGDHRLALGALISEEIRAEVLKTTGYECSAGIAHNKMLAKLGSGLHKPNAQTIFPQESVPEFFSKLPMQKIKGLGGKFGKSISEELGVIYIGQVTKFSEKELVKKFEEKTGKWLYNAARGIDLEPVKFRVISKSIGCCKQFPGKNCLVSPGSVERWVNELATEVSERLEKDMDENNRKAKQLVFSSTQTIEEKHITNSKTIPLNSYERSKIAKDFLQVINKNCRKSNGNYINITFLGISAGNFQDVRNNSDIKSFFNKISNHTEKPSAKMNCHSEQNKIHTQLLKDTLLTENLDVSNIIIIDADQNIVEDAAFSVQDEYTQSVCPQTTSVDNDSGASTSFFNKYFENSPKSGRLQCEDQDTGSDNNLLKSENPAENNEIGPECHESGEKICLECNGCEKCQRTQEESPNNNEEFRTAARKKRKPNDTPSVLTLFKNFEELNEDNSNYCHECNKRIKLEDVLNHDDYHTALKIHLQLNSIPLQSRNKVCSRKGKISKKNDSGNILNFFKYK